MNQFLFRFSVFFLMDNVYDLSLLVNMSVTEHYYSNLRKIL